MTFKYARKKRKVINTMIDGLKTMYDDFYGTGGDDSAKNDAGGKSSSKGGKPVTFEDIKPVTVEEGKSAEPVIETEIVTENDLQKRTATQPDAEPEPKEPEKSGMEELEELIGLKSVKHDVEELIGLAKVRKMRQEKDMKAVPVSLHLVFSGNPGTGKTTVARILAKLYKEIGILDGGQLVETDRSGLVAGYVGQTAIKTQKKIEEAMGGVLFIDEAYTLNQEGENYGQEAIDTILKAMEDHRDKFVVIVAGYTQLMHDFINSNPGLRSRFNKFFEFPDYTADELQQIFMMQCKKYQYELTEDAEAEARKRIIKMEAEKDENFANARAVRNLFEKIITNQASRVSNLENVDEKTLSLITIEDFADLDEDDDYSDNKTKDAFDKAVEEKLSKTQGAGKLDAQKAKKDKQSLGDKIDELLEGLQDPEVREAEKQKQAYKGVKKLKESKKAKDSKESNASNDSSDSK